MSEQPRTPDGKFTVKTGSEQETSTEGGDASTGVSINFSEIPDETTQQAVKQLLAERDSMKTELSEISARLQKMDEREQQLQLDKVRAEKLGELRAVDAELAEKHKDETNPKIIDLLIDTAKSYNSNFADYQQEDVESAEKKKLPLTRRDLMDGNFA